MDFFLYPQWTKISVKAWQQGKGAASAKALAQPDSSFEAHGLAALEAELPGKPP